MMVTHEHRDGPLPESSARYGGLIEQVLSESLENDYHTAAARREHRPQRRRPLRRLAVIVVLIVFGSMLAVSGLKAQAERPVAAAERERLVSQIHERQDHLSALHNTLTALQSGVSDLRDEVATDEQKMASLQRDVTRLGVVTGTQAVTGPGLVVTTDNAEGATAASTGGVILDTDLQALVNGLWFAGAEAIAINGHRLTSVSAIRYAGQAITVNYRSLSPPYVVTAIGDPDTLPARFLQSPGGRLWQGLELNFGIRFDTHVGEELVVPGYDRTSLRYATPVVSR